MVDSTRLCARARGVRCVAVAVVAIGSLGAVARAAAPANDSFAAAQDIAGPQGMVSGTNTDATSEGEATRGTGHTVWYRWMAPSPTCVVFDTDTRSYAFSAIDVFTGTSLAALTPVARANHTGLDLNRIVFRANADTVYDLLVDGYAATAQDAVTGDFVLHWTIPGAGPANDNLASTQSIGSALLGSVAGTNVDATPECGEPEIPNEGQPEANSGRSVWYRWTAPANIRMAFTTAGSTFDTLLAVYTGSSIDTLHLVVSNDDTPPFEVASSYVTFDAMAGQDYSIAVDGYDVQSGGVLLDWAQTPANDDFADAEPLSPTPSGSVMGNNLGASAEPEEPLHIGFEPGRSVWYVWQAPSNGATIFRTMSGGGFQAVVAVYTGEAVDALTSVPHDPEGGGVRFDAVAGQVYRVAVARGTGDAPSAPIIDPGQFTLSWGPPALPTATPTETATETPTETVTESPTMTPTTSDTPSPSATETPTETPSPSATPSPTLTPSTTETATETPASIPTQTSVETPTATATESATITPTASETPLAATDTPTETPSPSATPSTTETTTETPTQVATETAAETPTATPSASPTATTTPTATAPPCVGDCDGSGQVQLDDLVTGVSVALALQPADECLGLDVDGNGAVTVDELLKAVNNAVSQCP